MDVLVLGGMVSQYLGWIQYITWGFNGIAGVMTTGHVTSLKMGKQPLLQIRLKTFVHSRFLIRAIVEIVSYIE